MALLILCIKIFIARILDVTLGTVRTILTVKGKNIIASLIGFVEIAIWFTIVREAISTDQTGIWIVLAYSGGFATGTFIGIALSEKYIQGNFGVQVITTKKDEILKILKFQGYGVSIINVKGQVEEKEKYMLFIEINKKKFNNLKNTIKSIDPKAFIVVNETKYVQNGYIK